MESILEALEPVPKPVRMRGLVQHMAVHKRSHAEWVYFNDIEKMQKAEGIFKCLPLQVNDISFFYRSWVGKNTAIRPHSPKACPLGLVACCGGPKLIDKVQFFPRYVQLFAPQMPIGGKLAIDGFAQIQRFDNGVWTQIEYF